MAWSAGPQEAAMAAPQRWQNITVPEAVLSLAAVLRDTPEFQALQVAAPATGSARWQTVRRY